MKTLTRDDVTIEIKCEPEDTDYVGNCMASGNDDHDREAEEWIRDQLASGNEWAWCCVAVTVSWEGFEASDYLGCCSYRSEDDFKEEGGYYSQMVDDALDALNAKVQAMDMKLGKLR